MERFIVWVGRGVMLLFAVVFLEHLSFERFALGASAANAELERAMRVTFETVGGFLEAIAPPMFAITGLGAMVAVIISIAIHRRSA